MATKTSSEQRKAKVTQEHRDEAARLTELWETRIHETQGLFGERYDIGSQSAVGQFLRGEVPLSLKAASGFARGLKCQISDFSPRLARSAENFGLVASSDATDLTKLNRLELQLVQLYRGLTPDQRHDLMLEANRQYSSANPERSAANPFSCKNLPKRD